MGIYWTLWGIGWLFVVVTRIVLVAVDRDCDEYIAEKSVAYQVITITLMCICIALVGGIANALWIGVGISKDYSITTNVIGAIFIDLLPAVLTYVVGYFVLGLYKEDRFWVHTIFVVTFIVSIVLWAIPIGNYNYNIDYKEETSSSTEEYDLYYFCNIPVQQVSGNIDGSSFLGIGNVSGNISTSEELPYWYDNGSGEGLYDSVSADEAKIIFIQDGETPFVRIITYCKKEIEVDNNVGEESITEETYWKIYEFHLPREVMQYNIG
ncbi:MAG: hypothetical protein IJ272_10170 [Clostridia bacterium]|nr:hypothetical protein [Clostridia bacterium]